MFSYCAFVLPQDPRLTELHDLDLGCFAENPCDFYRDFYGVGGGVSLEEDLSNLRALHNAELAEPYMLEELQKEGKLSEQHQRGRERFHEILEAFILEHVPTFVQQSTQLAARLAKIHPDWDYQASIIVSCFISAVQDVCDAVDCPETLSEINRLPQRSAVALKRLRGVSSLYRRQTNEEYISSATGDEGFWGLWQDQIKALHEGSISLTSQDPSDFKVVILEVAGEKATVEEIKQAEEGWKRKRQVKETEMNSN